jgi:polyisoprenoid-binding protein YceI
MRKTASQEAAEHKPGRASSGASWLVLALTLVSLSFAHGPAPRQYALDLAQSQLVLTLVQEGLLSKKYPTHQVAVKNFDVVVTMPRDEKQTAVQVSAEAKSFANADKTMSEFERRGFHDVLHNKVLECDRFPAVQFKSVGLSDFKKVGDTRTFTLNGDLSLHGVTRRASFPVSVTLSGDQLLATGEAKLKQSDYGITPYSGSVGLIKIGDELQINFSIIAKLKPEVRGEK